MRILTLGVLIVSGGTLAALPFRRYRTIRDASVTPAQATGPTQSVLGSEKLAMLVEASSKKTNPVLAIAEHLPKWEPPSELDRRIQMPLTYEDLAIPVDRPDLVNNRFSATAVVRAEVNRRDDNFALVMPTMESISIQQQSPSESFASVQAPSEKATLASTATRGRSRDVSASEPIALREHHWIRQPTSN